MNERSKKEYWDERSNKSRDIDKVYEDVTAFVNSTELGHKIIDLFQGSMLDVGCGYGRFYRTDREYLGIDFSDGMIKQAKAKFPNGDFKVRDWTKDIGLYDVVFEASCLSSFGGPLEDFIKILLKHVNKNGVLIIFEAQGIHIIPKDNVFKYESWN